MGLPAAVFAWLLIPPAVAGPQVGAVIRAEGAMDIAGDRSDEDPLTYATWLRAFAKDELDRGDTWFVEGRLQHHIYGGEDIEGWWEPGLGETGVNFRLGGPDSPARLRAGMLEERWGTLQLLPILDVLNPRDARAGLLAPGAFQRLPIPMATLQLTGGSFRSETTLIPLASADRLWLRDTDWSPVRQGMMVDFFDGLDGEDSVHTSIIRQNKDQLLDLDPSLRRGEDAATNLDALPQAVLVNGEVAQRFELSVRNFDVAVMAGALRSRFPQAELIPAFQDVVRTNSLPDSNDTDALAALTENPVQMTWPRTLVTGLEASGLAGPFQIRGEGGFWTDKVVRQEWGNATTVPQIAAGLGVDYVYGSTFAASLEGRWQHLVNPPNDIVLAAEDQFQIAAGLRATLAADRLILTLGGAYDVTFSELIARPSIAWRISDLTQLELGAVLLEGFVTAPPETLQEVLNYKAGPASMWSQNDAVTLALSFFI